MASFAAAMLDELMGRNRNVDPANKQDDLHWDDPEVDNFMEYIFNLTTGRSLSD
jgi:hypothetical protein